MPSFARYHAWAAADSAPCRSSGCLGCVMAASNIPEHLGIRPPGAIRGPSAWHARALPVGFPYFHGFLDSIGFLGPFGIPCQVALLAASSRRSAQQATTAAGCPVLRKESDKQFFLRRPLTFRRRGGVVVRGLRGLC